MASPSGCRGMVIASAAGRSRESWRRKPPPTRLAPPLYCLCSLSACRVRQRLQCCWAAYSSGGCKPGPLLFVEQKEFVWGLIASMYLSNIIGLLVVLTCVPLFAAILRIPFSIIAPIILVFCAIGAYSVHNSTFDVVLMLVFGVVGYVLKKCNYPLAPMVLAIVLGDKAEEAFRQSLLSSQGTLGIFFSNGLVASVMALGLIALFWPMFQNAFAV